MKSQLNFVMIEEAIILEVLFQDICFGLELKGCFVYWI